MKQYIFILVICLLVSCTKDTNNLIILNNNNLEVADTIVRFADKNPIAITIKDSVMFILCVQSDTCMAVYDIRNNCFLKSFGTKGRGPEDVVEPSFILNFDKNRILLDDVNAIRFLEIKQDNNRDFYFSKFSAIPAEIYPSSDLSYDNDIYVGRQVGKKHKMFYVYNAKTKSKIDIDYNPKIPDIRDENYYLANHTAINSQKNRIIIGMYFLDMCQIYDMQGNRLQTIVFSENYIPDVENHSLNTDKGYSGICGLFPTTEACYILRFTEIPIYDNGQYVDNQNEYFLIKSDWDGNVESSFKIQGELQGQFYIDENENKLYVIRHVVESIYDDYYDVVTYNLK